MSFEKMNLPELKKVSEDFGVDVKPGSSKSALIAELLEMGVTYDMYQKFNGTSTENEQLPEEASSKLFKEQESKVLLKMERENGTYETRGYKFTRLHPYVAVRESDADIICRTEEGFRLALPSEVSQYYG